MPWESLLFLGKQAVINFSAIKSVYLDYHLLFNYQMLSFSCMAVSDNRNAGGCWSFTSTWTLPDNLALGKVSSFPLPCAWAYVNQIGGWAVNTFPPLFSCPKWIWTLHQLLSPGYHKTDEMILLMWTGRHRNKWEKVELGCYCRLTMALNRRNNIAFCFVLFSICKDI